MMGSGVWGEVWPVGVRVQGLVSGPLKKGDFERMYRKNLKLKIYIIPPLIWWKGVSADVGGAQYSLFVNTDMFSIVLGWGFSLFHGLLYY